MRYENIDLDVIKWLVKKGSNVYTKPKHNLQGNPEEDFYVKVPNCFSINDARNPDNYARICPGDDDTEANWNYFQNSNIINNQI